MRAGPGGGQQWRAKARSCPSRWFSGSHSACSCRFEIDLQAARSSPRPRRGAGSVQARRRPGHDAMAMRTALHLGGDASTPIPLQRSRDDQPQLLPWLTSTPSVVLVEVNSRGLVSRHFPTRPSSVAAAQPSADGGWSDSGCSLSSHVSKSIGAAGGSGNLRRHLDWRRTGKPCWRQPVLITTLAAAVLVQNPMPPRSPCRLAHPTGFRRPRSGR